MPGDPRTTAWRTRGKRCWRLRVDAHAMALTSPDGRDAGSAACAEVADREAVATAARGLLDAARAGPGGAPAGVELPLQAHLAAGCARLFLIPWAEALNSRRRWQTYAASRFEQIFGEPANAWEIRVAEDSPPRARLAVAAPAGLVAGLQSAAGAALQSLRIDLLDALSQLLRRERRFSGCVIEVEERLATAFFCVQGELRRVRARHLDSTEELVATVRSEWAAFGIAAPASQAGVLLLAGAAGADLGASLAAALGGARVISPP